MRGHIQMSWTIERHNTVAVVTMTTNPVNAQNRAFFADLHDAFDRLERDHPEAPVVLTGTGTRFSAGLDLGEHFPLFAGDPAAVASWFAGYRATNMPLFTYPRPACCCGAGASRPLADSEFYGLTVLVAEGELPESASARWPEGNPGQILDLTASVDVELPEDFAEVVVDGVRAEEQLCGDLVVG